MKLSKQGLLVLLVSMALLLAATLGVFGFLVYRNTYAPLPTSDAAQLSPHPIITLPPVAQETMAQVENMALNLASPERVPYQAVVQLLMLYQEQGGLTPVWVGSGTVISPDGLIVTNAHVALPDTDQVPSFLQIAFTGEQDRSPVPRFYAEVLQADAGLDIAVVRPYTDLGGNRVDCSKLNLAYVSIGDSDGLQLGDPLTIIGYPMIGGDTITLTRGDVGGFTHDDEFGDRAFIKTSATVAGGNSGGLAADSSGSLVAIPTLFGYGGSALEGDLVDCRPIADTNGDGAIDLYDTCVPVGGFINALRPVNLAMPLIEAARRGEVAASLKPGPAEVQPPTSTPTSTTLPGVAVMPLSTLDSTIPWLPMDRSVTPTSFYYGFNTTLPPFNSPQVRRAFALAVDREAIAEIARQLGSRDPAPATTFTPPEVLGRDLYGVVGLPFDPVRARDELAKAGYSDPTTFPKTTLVVNSVDGDASNPHLQVAQAITQMWRTHLGVDVDIEVMPWDAFVNRLLTDPPAIYRMGWIADYVDPDNFLNRVFHSGSGENLGLFYSPVFDSLVEEAARPGDPATRQRLYVEAERILCQEEAALIPLYHSTSTY